MASWQMFHDEAPELADRVRARFAANTHHVLGTLRADGTPRLSGTEVHFWGDDVVAGSMWQARKALDLQRDPRCAVHANPSDRHMVGGDAKFDAHAEEVTGAEHAAFYESLGGPDGTEGPPADESHLFRFDLRQVILTEVNPDAGTLTVNLWQPGEGVRQMTRT
ncbi:hypothetical protein [Rhabdothermincola salaria]|uniref:hypothetical protein n=1 Tax=Rhabdothermincola salaria TaxID=2903142 RepID=UPI001E50E67B|nr:hypothetical protein [Rhabdothermincola salaria]MCD9622817.1 hypothetical protein [Rhabdothermincola salaria]